MKKKIFILDPVPEDKIYMKIPYADAYRANHDRALNRIKSKDTVIVHKACPPGIVNTRYSVVDYVMNGLEVPHICKAAIEAEREGADAIIIACTDDPGLKLVRTLVDIPVVGETESTMHLACMMGHKFGLISWPTRPFMARGQLLIRTYGLEAKAVVNPTEPLLTPSPTAEKEIAMNGFTNPKKFVKKYYIPAARKLMERGAEVIVLHSTGLSILAENAGFNKVEGLTEYLGEKAYAPVLNAVSVSLKMAEMMVDLHRTLGIPSVSRIGLYQKPESIMSKKDLLEIRRQFEKDR